MEKGWGGSAAGECLPRRHRALGWSTSTKENKASACGQSKMLLLPAANLVAGSEEVSGRSLSSASCATQRTSFEERNIKSPPPPLPGSLCLGHVRTHALQWSKQMTAPTSPSAILALPLLFHSSSAALLCGADRGLFLL